MEKRARRLSAAAVLLIALCAAIFLWYNHRIVARMDGVYNYIYYDGLIYQEDFHIQEFETSSFLGLLDWGDGRTRSKLYAIVDMPAYLYVDMGWDYRIYVLMGTP